MRFRRYRDPPKGSEPTPRPKEVRRWSDEYLHSRLAKAGYQPYHRAVIESELRIREAWRSPEGWSMVISILALLIAVASLIATVIANGAHQ